MGAQREDTDPTPQKGGTEPGIGPPSATNGSSQEAPTEPEPVDFDALHAALGAVEEPIVVARRRSVPDTEPPPADPTLPPPPEPTPTPTQRVGESQGRSSAQYASARPHTIPPTRAPDEPPDIPAVIVATDDTVPAAPPAMTTPLGAPPPPMPQPASGPHQAAQSQSQPSYPFTPQPFPVQRMPPQPTIRMPERPRRPKQQTIVVRKRGPSAIQKLAAFMAMLLLVTAVGIAVIIWRRPGWLGIDAFQLGGEPSAAPLIVPSTPPAPQASVTAPPSAPPPSASVTASASASTKPRPPPPKPSAR
jgi:hypothetical protein